MSSAEPLLALAVLDVPAPAGHSDPKGANIEGNGSRLPWGSVWAQAGAVMLRVCQGQAGVSHSSLP